jgi:hypothetical protein
MCRYMGDYIQENKTGRTCSTAKMRTKFHLVTDGK